MKEGKRHRRGERNDQRREGGREVQPCMKAAPPPSMNGGTVNGRGQWAVGRQCGQATHLCGILPLVA